jgi:glucokinase-like ROK family protein
VRSSHTTGPPVPEAVLVPSADPLAGPHADGSHPQPMTPRYRTGDQNWVRERNLAIALSYLWEAGRPISRTEMVNTSGLNKSTVGSLLAQLQAWSFVKEGGRSEPRPGRPGMLLDINPDGGRLIGVEIGVGFVSAVVTDMKAEVVWQQKVDVALAAAPSRQHQTRVLESAERLVQAAIAKAVGRHRLLGIGVGVPGLVDHETGTLLFAPNLHWRDVPLRDRWIERFGVPVIVENEANAAALGEQMLGTAKGGDDFIYLSAGVGLGGGLVVHGKLYGGSGGFAGEVGHMTIVPDGPRCNCGNRGCWETLASPTAIIRQVREAIAGGRSPRRALVGDGAPEALQMDQVLQAAASGDPVVLEILSEVGRYLGIGIANLINVFNPSLVVMGGVLSLVAPYVLPRAHQEVEARAVAAPRRGVQILVSRFKFDACVMGGVSLILRKILSDPAAWRPRQRASGRPESALVLRRGAL